MYFNETIIIDFLKYRRGKGEREERDVALRYKKYEMCAGRWGDWEALAIRSRGEREM